MAVLATAIRVSPPGIIRSDGTSFFLPSGENISGLKTIRERACGLNRLFINELSG
jgi:hypothetical protein